MIVTLKEDTLTVVFDKDEQIIIDWVIANYGSTILETTLKDLIRGRKAQMEATLKDDMWNAFKDHPEKAAITDMLGIKS